MTLNDQVDHTFPTSLFQEVLVLLWFSMRMETPPADMISTSTKSPTDPLLSTESLAPGPINYTLKWDFFTQTHKHKYAHRICLQSTCWHVHHRDVKLQTARGEIKTKVFPACPVSHADLWVLKPKSLSNNTKHILHWVVYGSFWGIMDQILWQTERLTSLWAAAESRVLGIDLFELLLLLRSKS